MSIKYAGTPRAQSMVQKGGICALVPQVIIGIHILPRAYKNVNFSVLNAHVLVAEAIAEIVREIAKYKKYVFGENHF